MDPFKQSENLQISHIHLKITIKKKKYNIETIFYYTNRRNTRSVNEHKYFSHIHISHIHLNFTYTLQISHLHLKITIKKKFHIYTADFTYTLKDHNKKEKI